MPVTGSPTQQRLDGTQVNRRRGNRTRMPRSARESKLSRLTSESETVIPCFSIQGTHIAKGCDDRPVVLPTVVPSKGYQLIVKNTRSRTRKYLSSHSTMFKSVRWNENVPLAALKVLNPVKASEHRFKVHTGEDNPQLDIGSAQETVSSEGWKVVRASMTRHGKIFIARCLLSNGKYEKKVTFKNILNEKDLLNKLWTIERATV